MSASTRPRVLVAEDEASLRRLLELRLNSQGFDVSVAADGEAALAMVEEVQPDVLVCDIMMPRKDGLRVCRELRAEAAHADLPIVLLTARSLDSNIQTVLALGGIIYINKPYDHGELTRALHELVPMDS